MTKRELMMAICEAKTNEATALPKDVLSELFDYAEKEIELMDKRNERRKSTQSKKQVENNAIKEQVFNAVQSAGAEGILMKDLMPSFNAFSVQKISALVSQLADEGKVIREKGKNRTVIYKCA